jgi:hypothetical protein
MGATRDYPNLPTVDGAAEGQCTRLTREQRDDLSDLAAAIEGSIAELEAFCRLIDFLDNGHHSTDDPLCDVFASLGFTVRTIHKQMQSHHYNLHLFIRERG